MKRCRYLFTLVISAMLLFFSLTPVTYATVGTQAKAAAAAEKGHGTLSRKWVTTKESLSVNLKEITVQENITVPTSDGTVLKGRLLLPAGVSAPLPTIVQLNGYGIGEYGGYYEKMLIDLAKRGYAVLHVSTRGTGGSGGSSGLYEMHGEDGYDVIEWAADQPWSSGKVGMTGFSLLAISEWLTAKEMPPSLKAISPVAACADCYDYLWYPGGMEAGPGRVSRTFEYNLAKEHRNYDDWWKARSLTKQDLENIAESGVAALISGGWNDYLSPGNVKAFQQYKAAGGTSKLIMSPGNHSYLTGVMPYSFEDYQALWFDHYLKGEKNGVDSRDPVLIYVQGPNQWRYEKNWPLHDTDYVRLFLSEAKSNSISSRNDGTFTINTPKQNQASASYTYSPVSGPFLPTLLDSSGRTAVNQRPYEEKTVTWTTGLLPEALEVTGNISLSFWAETNAADADFVVQITDVAPDGSSKQVSAGYLNAARASSRTTPAPLKAGNISQYMVDVLPTSYVFQKGHRIRLSIAGGAKKTDDQSSPQGPGLNPTASTVKIHLGAAYPSSLTLPVIGTNPFASVKKPSTREIKMTNRHDLIKWIRKNYVK